MAITDYEIARQRANRDRVLSRIFPRPTTLLTLNQIKDGRVYGGQRIGNLQQVPIDRIVGSVNRTSDFDRRWNPLNNTTRHRWESVNRAYLEGIILPPVTLQKVVDTYYVIDGHHRISVARFHGATHIDAIVTESICPAATATAAA
jgi:hypothetical protein